MVNNTIVKTYKTTLKYSIMAFFILLSLEVIQIYNDVDDYKLSIYNQKESYLNIIISDTKNISDLIFENIINTPEIILVFENASSGDTVQKDKARQELYWLLQNKYKTFKKYGVQQLHFHLVNNESFLRFHKPGKYGDNLTDIRASVKYVNEYQKSTFGFEEGKIFSGYRFVYPLFDSNHKHIGSVEISQSLLSFKHNYEDNNDEHIDFILKKNVVEEKVFKDQMSNYVSYMSLENFLIQKEIYISNVNDNHISLRDKLLKEIFNDKNAIKSIDKLEKLSMIRFDNFQLYSVIFMPLLNDFINKKVGYSIIISKYPFQEKYVQAHIINFLGIFILSIFIGIFFTKKEMLKVYHEKSAQNYQLITDLSNSIIIAVENNMLKSVNKKFKDFFDTKEKVDEESIKEIFLNAVVKKNDYLYLNNPKTFYYDIQTSDNNEIVLKDKIGFEKIFEISSHRVNINSSKDFVIELVDITEFKKEVHSLKNKAYTDTLTQIHNRLYFDNIFYKEFQYMHEYKIDLSLIMFDIDYFKKINDKYGHNVGDNALVFLVNIVNKSIRKDDVFCRWGGEEFMIITHNTLNDSVAMANNLRKAVDHETQRDEKIPHFTCSFGVISLMDMTSQKEAIQNVDTFLYKAKDSGRNIVISS